MVVNNKKMLMKKIKSIFVITVILIFSVGFVQHTNAQTYKFTSVQVVRANNDEPFIKMDMFIKVHMQQYIDDSLMMDTRESMPAYMPINSTIYDTAFLDNLLHSKKGDSLICIMPMDSLENKLSNISGKFFKALIKIENVFESDSTYQNDYNAEMALAKLKEETERNARKITEEQDIAAYLSQQSIQAIKTKNVVFVQIIKKGNGRPITKGKKVRVNYSGKTLDGKVFDSNIDPEFYHVQPFEFRVGAGNVIQGWDDGICLFNEGGKGTLYIPSNMGYWKQGAGENIKPYENLIFDIEILQASANSKKSYKPLTKKKLIKKKQ